MNRVNNRNYHIPQEGPRESRPTCFTCFRPLSHCVCSFIKPFTAHCNFLILQHPHERKKYYSTTKLVSQAITNAMLLRGVEFTPEKLENLIAQQETYLLYPSTTAIDCEQVVLNSNKRIIVIDGTWREARKIIFRNQILKTLPCITFKQPLRSNYRIRKQPKENYLSTLESIGHLLKLNAHAYRLSDELQSNYDTLFTGFDKMIDQLIQYWPSRDQQNESASHLS